MAMEAQSLTFEAHPEKGPVSALLVNPSGAKSLVVLGHGAGAGMQHANMENIARTLANHQIATFRFQFPFMERGGGRDSQEVSLSTVQHAVATAEQTAPSLKLFAGGHSFGGRMTSLAAADHRIDQAEGLIFFAFPLHAPGKPGIERAKHLGNIRQPMLFLSGTRDPLNSMDLFEPLVSSLGNKATLHKLETADHSYKILKRTRTNQEDVFDEMAGAVANWINKR
jgi:predicted alpha/beta-hydrolase family hydrolase